MWKVRSQNESPLPVLLGEGATSTQMQGVADAADCLARAARGKKRVTKSQHEAVATRRVERIATHNLLRNAMYGVFLEAGHIVAMENPASCP
eukprot:SM000016S01973  [mRNA]  locus=s16:948447:949459:- [translate_table: standard]